MHITTRHKGEGKCECLQFKVAKKVVLLPENWSNKFFCVWCCLEG